LYVFLIHPPGRARKEIRKYVGFDKNQILKCVFYRKVFAKFLGKRFHQEKVLISRKIVSRNLPRKILAKILASVYAPTFGGPSI
jgi:hypothetical protein